MADVQRAKGAVQERLDKNFFRVRMDRITPAEKSYLLAMAEMGPGPHRSGDVASRLGVKVESVAPRRSSLIRKGMLYSPAHGDTAFTVPLFDEFLRREADDQASASRPLGLVSGRRVRHSRLVSALGQLGLVRARTALGTDADRRLLL